MQKYMKLKLLSC